MASVVILIILVVALYILVSGGVGMYLAIERGNPGWYGWLVGMFAPLIGHILLAMKPATNQQIIEDVYSRGLMNKSDYEKTQEIIVKQLKEEQK